MTAALMVACGDGPAELTIVDDLRILDVRVDPAAPAPGEVPAMDLTVADPQDVGFEAWSWWCVGDVCGTDALPEGPVMEVNALACAPGACDGPGELDDPGAWMPDLGFEGVSLVRRIVPMSPSAQVRINTNPTFELVSEIPASVAIASTTPITFTVEDADVEFPTAYGYATWGGFRMAAGRPVIEGKVTVEYVAPEEPGEADLFVILEDGLGGSAVWTGSVVVE